MHVCTSVTVEMFEPGQNALPNRLEELRRVYNVVEELRKIVTNARSHLTRAD